MSKDRLVKVVLAIRDGLTEIVERVNDVLKEYTPSLESPRGYVQTWMKKLQRNWLRASEGQKLELGEYEFRFSGDKSQSVSRRPIKK